MKIHRVQIEQQAARIGVESRRASLDIKTRRRTMTVENSPPEMSVTSEDPKVTLDLQQFRNSIGLKSIRTLADESVARAQAHVLESIRALSADGDAVATLPSQGNPIAQVARRRMLQDKTPEICSGEVPPGPIKMEGDPGKLSIDWSRNELKIEWGDPEPPVITVEPKASVEVHLEQMPSVKISVVELSIPPETGARLDERI